MADVIRAFSEEHTERLTGLTLGQLRYWDRTGFYAPSLAADDRRIAFSRIYSYRDILALRVLRALRHDHNVSLQHLRQVRDRLGGYDEERWTKTTLYVLNKRVVITEPGTEAPREVVSGQYTFRMPLAVVVSDTRKALQEFSRRPNEKVGTVERHRFVAHNTWVVGGTRIPIMAIRRFHDAGYSFKQIIREYPDLTRRDIEAALARTERSEAA
jgi:uncharacterized protein (DUF433 family)/DNA-binding transcriptional MerR regulator